MAGGDWRKAPAYLEWVRAHPCIACLPAHREAEPHHFIGEFAVGGMGLKAPDLLSMPLCRAHHDAVHAAEDGWRERQREWVLRTLIEAIALGIVVADNEGNLSPWT